VLAATIAALALRSVTADSHMADVFSIDLRFILLLFDRTKIRRKDSGFVSRDSSMSKRAGRSPAHNISVEALEMYIIRKTEHSQTSTQKRSFGPI
jgi:hypothetical protein